MNYIDVKNDISFRTIIIYVWYKTEYFNRAFHVIEKKKKPVEVRRWNI